MGLKIFGDDAPTAESAPKQSFADDVVGRFRSGYQINGRPAALQAWRVTTGDPDVADAVKRVMGGTDPQEWEAKGEDNLEVFTEAGEVDVIIDGTPGKSGDPRGLRTRMILWGRNGKPIYTTDGETITKADGTVEPDPDAALSLQERKQKAQDGVGPEPSVEVYFRLADDPDLGIFKFVSASWSLVRDLHYYGTEAALVEVGGPAVVTLGLEEVSFVAKNGPRAGQTVSFTKPTLKVKGAAA